MRFLKQTLAATAMTLMLSATAHAADCRRVSVEGQALGYSVAELFSKNGLKNTIYGQGREGRGPVKTTCKTDGAMTTCHSSQMACKVGDEKLCLGAWLCSPL
ncbi:MAG: hypothetical protein EKK41_22230 [Hyphomicrobiales bacterium]|nr:MAG: hypothetical protein EKK41_22230 [Hyphomicrobiales bacterium]